MSAPVKPGIKLPKDEIPQVPAKPTVQRRPSSVYNMTRSMTVASPDASSHENSMTTSLYTGSVSTANQESKEINHSNEVPVARQPPAILPKKPAIGALVLPKIESTGADGGPPLVKQRRPPLEKKRKTIFFVFFYSENFFFSFGTTSYSIN